MADFFSLDVGETQIRIADVKKKGKLFEAEHLALIDIDPLFYRTDSEAMIEKTASTLSKTFEQIKFKKKEANVIIPDSYSYNQFIEMPKLNEKELISAIRYQADQFIPMPLDEVNLDIEVVNEDTKAKKMLVFLSAAPKAIVEKVKKLLEYAGLFPESIEPETSAIGRATSEIFKKDSKMTSSPTGQSPVSQGLVFLNMNPSSTSVYYFDQSLGLLIYSHNFSIGYNLFLKEIQVNLNVDPAKAHELLKSFGLSQSASYHLETILGPGLKDFLTEIDRTIKEITTKYKSQISTIYCLNDTLKFHSLENLIGKFFAIPASVFDPYTYFVKNNMGDFFKNDLSYFLAAVGGALR